MHHTMKGNEESILTGDQLDALEDAFPNGAVFFDLETTGLSPVVDETIEIAGLKITPGLYPELFHRLVRPRRPIRKENFAIHGISNEMVGDAQEAPDVFPLFVDFLENLPVVAHNAKFDCGFLTKHGFESKLSFRGNKVYDSIILSRLLFKKGHRFETTPKGHKLSQLASYFDIQLEHHRAMEDAVACAAITAELIKLHQTGMQLEKDRPLESFIQKSYLFDLSDFKEHQLQLATATVQGKQLEECLVRKKKVEIKYKGGSRGLSWRPVLPVALLSMPKDQYLYAQCLLSEQYKYFQLGKIKGFKIFGRAYKRADLFIGRRENFMGSDPQ